MYHLHHLSGTHYNNTHNNRSSTIFLCLRGIFYSMRHKNYIDYLIERIQINATCKLDDKKPCN